MKIITITCCLLLSVNQAEAIQVFLTNNTDSSITITNKHYVKSNPKYIQIQPNQTLKITDINNKSLSKNLDYEFETQLSLNGCTPIVLKQKFRQWSTWLGLITNNDFKANMFVSDRNGNSWSFPFISNFNESIRKETRFCDEREVVIHQKFHSPGLFSENQLHYAIENSLQNKQVIKENNENELNITAYNIYGVTIPFLNIGWSPLIKERFSLIPSYLLDNDVVVFNEAFNDEGLEILKIKMYEKGFKYSTSRIDGGVKLSIKPKLELPRLLATNGGVIIFSRWPIVNGENNQGEQLIYDSCSRIDDCLSSKGVMYAVIQKNNTKYHVFGTHTQAWEGEADIRSRFEQLKQMKNFVDSKNISASEPVIYAGDLNVDRYVRKGEDYKKMLTILDSPEPNYKAPAYIEDKVYTYDHTRNNLASDASEYLDYILTSNSHKPPLLNSNEIKIFRSADKSVWTKWDLSDHYPVQSNLKF